MAKDKTATGKNKDIKKKDTKVAPKRKSTKISLAKKVKPEKVVKPKVKKKSSLRQSFTLADTGFHWETDRIVLRILDDKDYIRKFAGKIFINKGKIGAKTEYEKNKWATITDVITDEKNLVFVMEPIFT